MASPASELPDRPCLRPLQAHRGSDGTRTGVVLIDPLGVAPGQAFVPDALLPILALFDGEHSLAAIQARLRASGVRAPAGFVADLVRRLEEALLLDSPRAAAAIEAAAGEFLGAGTRPARHAGSAGYPREPDALRFALDTMLGPRGTSAPGPTPRGLIAPHIDLARGAAGYAAAYRWLAERAAADVYVVFGTGHQGPAAPLTGLHLDWDTPLGVVRTDRAFLDAVHARLGPCDVRDVLLHRDEHSLEFQMLMLRHVLGDRPFHVAGFLCGHLPSADGDPSQEAYVASIADAFRRAAGGARVCFVAGADLAHVGPEFGDPTPVDAARLRALEVSDRARLAHLLGAAPGAFHRHVDGDGNTDRVCGTTPMFLTALLAGGAAEMLHYGQACAPEGTQVVTFASLGYA